MDATTDANPEKVDNTLTGRVLVVEDVAANRKLVQVFLEKMGFEVTEALDGVEALEKVTEDSFDLILMDMNMPNMDGYEATRILRERKVSTPIIALTAYAMKGDENQCIEAGCDDYLPKPVDSQCLKDIVNKHMTCPQNA